MKRSLVVIPLFVVSTTFTSAFAADFGDSIPTAVAERLISSINGGEAHLSAGIMAGFPPFELPQGMSVLASLDQGYTQRVILTSRFDTQAASALAYGALIASGWQLIPGYGNPQPQTGFINPSQPIGQTQLCHPQYGMMNVMTNGGLDATYVHISRNVLPPGAPPQVCDADPVAQQQQAFIEQRQRDPYNGLLQYVPRLVMPNSDGMSAPPGYGGGGGGLNEWETRTTLKGSWDIKRVFKYFADQIADQGWKRDANVVGAQMASGSWTKAGEGDIELTASLTVLATGDDAYDLHFRLLRIGGPDDGLPTGFAPAGALGIRGIPAAGIRVAPINSTQIIRD